MINGVGPADAGYYPPSRPPAEVRHYQPAAGARHTDVTVNRRGPFGPYYHLRLPLTASSIDFSTSDRSASSGGQFELHLVRDRFPIDAPHCRGSILLRMPWTAPTELRAGEKIATKQRLLDRILALQRSGSASVDVVVELNPYVKAISRSPLRLELTGCNVFFRHAFGAYIDDTAPLLRRR